MAFKSIFVDGKISNPQTGNVAHLRLISEGETLPYLESVSISLERGANMDMSMTLAPPYEKAIELISKDNEWLRLGNTLGLRWGYADVPGAITDWYYGFMQMPDVSFGDEISITVPATTLAWNADRISRMKSWASEESPRTFKNVAEEIAKRYELIAEFGDLTPRTKYLIEFPQTSMVQGGRTDLQFLLQEGERWGVRMIARNQYLHFVDAAAPLPGHPNVNATFKYYGKIDVWNSVFPMTGFNPESMGTMFLKQFQGTNALAYGPNDDPATKKDPVVATDETAENKAFTSQDTVANPPETDGRPPQDMEDVKTKATVKVDPSAGEGGKIFCLPLNGKETTEFIEGFLSGARENNAEEHGISVNFESFALPNLLPGMFVRLEGIGDYFSGTYMLQKMDVNIDAGGASMTADAFGRGFPAVNRLIDPFAGMVKAYEDPAKDQWFDLLTEVKVPEEQ